MTQVKTFFIRTYGCQMNELDSEVLVGLLQQRGLTQVSEEKKADIILFNTCSVRDLAERKVLGKLGTLGRKKNKPIIGILGCMANAKKDELLKKFSYLDFVLGTNNVTDIHFALDQAIEKKRVCHTDLSFKNNIDYKLAQRTSDLKAYVSIIRGCDKYCTYCVVPYTRGKEISRSPQDILQECKYLAEKGYKEITLLGQNVNSYGKDFSEKNFLFHDLLSKIDSIEGLQRIRFLTSHPIDITKDLMYAIRDLPSVCEFLHFPIQAGYNRILKKMHRIYTKEEYLEKIEFLKNLVPNITFGTDIIVGFPTETEIDFQETLDIFKQVKFSIAYIYAYSPRKGTPAMRFTDNISEEIKQDRLHRTMELYEQICVEERTKKIGSTTQVLVERLNKDGKLLKGKTRHFDKVIFEGSTELIGSLQQVQLHDFTHQTFTGKLITSS